MSIRNIIKKSESIPLDSDDIIAMTGHRPKIKAMIYDDIKKFSSLNNLFGNHLGIATLLTVKDPERKYAIGH